MKIESVDFSLYLLYKIYIFRTWKYYFFGVSEEATGFVLRDAICLPDGKKIEIKTEVYHAVLLGMS